MVDGIEVICSEHEEAQIRNKWALNDAYPEYSGHLMWDGVNEPLHHIRDCQQKHKVLVEKIINEKLIGTAIQIEEAQEEGDLIKERVLIARRKYLKSFLNLDFSEYQDIRSLKYHLEEMKEK